MYLGRRLFDNDHDGREATSPLRSWREHSRHDYTPRTPRNERRGPARGTPRSTSRSFRLSYTPMNDTPPRARYHSKSRSQHWRDSDDRVLSSHLGKRRRSTSPGDQEANGGDPTPSHLRLTKKRKGAKLRVAIQALNTTRANDDEPGDLDDCRVLSYSEYVEMVSIIANAKKHAVE